MIGAGAAGLMAAFHATEAGAPTVLIERTRDGGRKILISGGGRCNVLPSRLDPRQYVTASSANTMRRMLLAWPLDEQRAFFERRLNLPLELEPETGKLFPRSERASDVRNALVGETRKLGAQLLFSTRVVGLEPIGDGSWQVRLDSGDAIAARAVIVATGGLSVPQTGSDGTGLRIVERLGHTLNPTYPALTPLLCDPPRHAHLAGVSLDVAIDAPLRKGRFSTAGGFLFTHRGYSGPAVLNVSHLAVLDTAQPLHVRWTGDDAEAWDRELQQAAAGTAASLLRRRLPTRLADALLQEAGVPLDRSLAELRRDERRRLVNTLARYPLPHTGDEGYKKAEVTGGGVDLRELDPHTLESRIHPGLHLCGEILDAFGPIGGYNFAWAWSTGRAAGRAAAASLSESGS